MKAITINVSEPDYLAFQIYAKERDRTTSELIREAMAEYRKNHMQQQTSLRSLPPAISAGGPIAVLTSEDDLLGEMLDDKWN